MSFQSSLREKNSSLYKSLTWNWTAAQEQQEPIFRKIVETYKPKSILEIGTFEGVSTALYASLVDKVITVDIIHNKLAEQVWECVGVRDKITRYVFNTQKERDKTIEDTAKQVDMCFIDGSHLMRDLVWDFKKCIWCNVIVLHDYGWELEIPKAIRKAEHGWPDVTEFVDFSLLSQIDWPDATEFIDFSLLRLIDLQAYLTDEFNIHRMRPFAVYARKADEIRQTEK